MTDRYEGPLPAELAAMGREAIALALLDIIDAIDAGHARCDPSHPALYTRRRWLNEANRRLNGASRGE